MKIIPLAVFVFASGVAYAQPAQPPAERAATPRSCDNLVGMEKEACLKQGGTVKANSAGSGGSSAASQQNAPAPAVGSSFERTAEPDAKKDYTKPEAK